MNKNRLYLIFCVSAVLMSGSMFFSYPAQAERQQKHVFQMFHIGILSEIRIGISWKNA